MTRVACGTVLLMLGGCSTSAASAIADGGGRGDGTDAGLTADVGADVSAEGDARRPSPAAIPPTTTFYWQISGVIDPARAEAIYDVDLFDAAPAGSSLLESDGTRVSIPLGRNPGIVGALHAKGKKVVCYVDTGAWENYRPDKDLFPPDVLGTTDVNWPLERWLDIRPSSWPKFEGLILARFDLAASLGCDAIEGDQNNSMGNNPGFPIGLADEVAWYAELAKQIHARGMGAIMKNGIELLSAPSAASTVALYEAALNESCNQFSECGGYASFVSAGKAVWNVEYTTASATFCPPDTTANYDGYFANLALDGTTWNACR